MKKLEITYDNSKEFLADAIGISKERDKEIRDSIDTLLHMHDMSLIETIVAIQELAENDNELMYITFKLGFIYGCTHTCMHANVIPPLAAAIIFNDNISNK